MKKHGHLFLIYLLVCLIFQNCEVQNDNQVPEDIAVQNFIWKGLNLYYLWQADVPNLADSRFNDQSDLNHFLYGYSDPNNLFQNLLNKPRSLYPYPGDAIDRFSVLTDDYYELEGILAGTTKNNGADYGLFYKDSSQTDVFGVVRYVLPNSDAAAKGIQRGAIFYGIDGIALNKNNYSALLNPDTYTLNFADYDNGNITPNGQSVSLTKTILSENPVYLNTVIDNGAHRIGYLMYNGFYPNYESQLNAAFASLKAQNITELVLDLRYNSGGSIATATHLASMITGQFPNQVFGKEQWNAKLEDYYSTHNPSSLYNLFTTKLGNNETISSLNLTKIYILTTKGTASASELIINGLKPYINVVQIGDVTIGKNVGSITLYDSPDFSKRDRNSKHRYAMQPLVLKIVNKAGFGDYTNGLEPNFTLKENYGNLGVLGNSDEPLLNLAINTIIGSGRNVPSHRLRNFELLQDTRTFTRLKSEMYIDKLPILPSN